MTWAAMLQIAVLRLGLAPEAFWRLSLVEWRALTAPSPDQAPLSRAAFERLAEAHPDAVIPAPRVGPEVRPSTGSAERRAGTAASADVSGGPGSAFGCPG